MTMTVILDGEDVVRTRMRGGADGRRRKPPAKTSPGETRYSCQKATTWDGNVDRFKDGSFCSCGWNRNCPNFGLCGGTEPNSGSNCKAVACQNGRHTFDDNTWTIHMKGDIINGNPYRAFAYLYFGLKSTTSIRNTNTQMLGKDCH